MDDRTFLELFDSLKRGMEARFDSVDSTLERIEARLDRQGGVIQGGTKQIARLITWSEDIDRIIKRQDEEVEELKRRLDRLEHGERAA